MSKDTIKVEISKSTIVFSIGLLFGIWFLFQVRVILIMLFISFLLMNAIAPVVKIGKKFKIPTVITVLISYIIIISLLSSIVATLIPAVVQQTSGLISQLPDLLDNLGQITTLEINGSLLDSHISSIPSNLFRFAAGALTNIFNILAIFFMTYYLTIERPNLHKYLVGLMGDGKREQKSEKFVRDLEKMVGGWIRAELILMLIVGVMTYVGLLLLNVPYALPLAVLAGLLEIIPNIGPTVAAIPAIIVAFSISPLTALGTLALNVLVQQLESNLIVPRVMQSITGINPLVTIVLLFTGFTLSGVTGAVLAIPLYLTGVSFIKNFK